MFTHTKDSKSYKQLENFFSGELASLTERDEYVFPYVVDLLVRMVTPSTTFVDDDTPLSITYLELKKAKKQGLGPQEMSEFFRAAADEVFFYCGWTPERFGRNRRPVGLDFYINYGVTCYSNAAEILWELKKEGRAATLSYLVDQYIDWTSRVNTIRTRAEKNIALRDIWQSLIANSSLDDDQISQCIEHFDKVADESELPGPKAIADQYRRLLGEREIVRKVSE